MSKRRSLLVQGSVVCSLGLAGCITPVDVPPTPSLPSSPGSHYWSSKTTTFGPSILFSGNEGIAPEAAVEKNNNPSMPNKESAVLSEKEKEELAYASARLAAPYFCFVERTLTDALIVNVKDKYVSIDEVLAEAEKFDTNDSIAREMSNLALSKLQTLRDYLVHAGDTSGFPAGT
ncbi:MAG: hypothetical protein Q7R96_01560, partial [Nanoarchaeota archaeon]|nr:hypothetical protein [Nanoarchaeota archaeon]